MKEADLFRQYAKEAMRWSSSKSASADERRALIDLACRYAQAASMSEVAPSRVPQSVRCREIWERVRRWAPAPVWLQVVLLE